FSNAAMSLFPFAVVMAVAARRAVISDGFDKKRKRAPVKSVHLGIISRAPADIDFSQRGFYRAARFFPGPFRRRAFAALKRLRPRGAGRPAFQETIWPFSSLSSSSTSSDSAS